MDQNIYTADFESNNSEKAIAEKETNIWLWDICSVNNYEHRTGRTMEEFIETCNNLSPCVMYFHNLKFDGMFIINWLLVNGYKHSVDKKLMDNEFSCLISELGQFYSIKVCFKTKGHKKKIQCEFRDSSKKIQGTVERIAKDYKLPILKGEIDYKLDRPIGYVPNDNEISYIHNDTEIIARVLHQQYLMNMNRMTSSSDTYTLYKKSVNEKTFDMIYPKLDLEIDGFIRNAYRGGVCMVNPKYSGQILHDVHCYDVNSMYPHKMCYSDLPYGKPYFFKGKYKHDRLRPLYIQHLFVDLKVKDGFMPTILNKKHLGALSKTYIKDTQGVMVELWLTNIDLDLMFSHYDVLDIEYVDGYKFPSSNKLFINYILPIYEKKSTTTGAEKATYKILMNSLYGKFASNPKHIRKIPFLDNETEVIKFVNGDVDIGEPLYTAVSVFITAQARKQLFDAIDTNIDNFVYCDTDSVHIVGKYAEGLEVDDYKLGAWSLEKTYITAKYLAQKTYYGWKTETEKDIKIAGCPQAVKDKIEFENFNFDAEFDGKLLPKRVKGGVILCDTTFTIKER